ncbi:LacI family DNA-binding transcriptional regulator [Nonomuraea sp. NPDC050786]|uniref:LacI family DNA-binding transcriptional regulator n=1 Tax=Nonomuraea sp. NPDC050786 TaxID=3154840 RepID=UPI0033C99D47
MTKRPSTLADVARAAGTSTAVVSYVINNGPRPVAAATRERVLAAAAELGYRPNRIARALRSRSTGVVGLVLADASNPYFGALARYVEQALERRDRLTLVGNAGYSPERQGHLVERFLAAQVDGLVIVSSDTAGDSAAPTGVPAVYVHHGPAGGPAPVVAADNRAAVRQAVAHLREHGHRSVAFLAGPHDGGPVGVRREAWEAAVGGDPGPVGVRREAVAGGEPGPVGVRREAVAGGEPGSVLLRSDYSRAAADALTRRLIAEGALPRALIAATDEQAIGVLSGAWACGVPVPDRLALISLDGTPESAYTAPALTVTEQPLQAMAEQAVDLLLSLDGGAEPPAAALVPRRSCGCAA